LALLATRDDGIMNASSPRVTAAAIRWRAELAGWQIPESILASAPESPYGFPAAMFRADHESPANPSRDRALQALPEGGTVLDIGCGGGRASMALVPPAGRVVGVDSAAEMLSSFAHEADLRQVNHSEIHGSWPQVSTSADAADVVIAHHVIYNVPDLIEFATALARAARHRVVLELTDTHPWVPTNDLWSIFHGLDRPAGPTAALAADVLRSCGIPVQVQSWQRPARPASREQAVSFIRRRLCLPVAREGEVDAALATDYQFAERGVTTLWWDYAASSDPDSRAPRRGRTGP